MSDEDLFGDDGGNFGGEDAMEEQEDLDAVVQDVSLLNDK